jgi:hypothetical protein
MTATTKSYVKSSSKIGKELAYDGDSDQGLAT